MLKLNGKIIEFGCFPDGTIAVKQSTDGIKTAFIEWYYENEYEFVGLIFIAKHLKSHGIQDIELFMPYIPNARMDRVKDNEDVFTLKYFAEILNSLNFKKVTVLDPHSNVSQALIENLNVIQPKEIIEKVITNIVSVEGKPPFMFYPDEGAGKRYSGMVTLPYAFGIKKRDWKTGDILGLDVAGSVEEIKGACILIIDDICSRGGTFLHSARKLKELGAENIYLYISHCEKTVLDGELLKSGFVKKIFTTNSICNLNHELIEIINLDENRESI